MCVWNIGLIEFKEVLYDKIMWISMFGGYWVEKNWVYFFIIGFFKILVL